MSTSRLIFICICLGVVILIYVIVLLCCSVSCWRRRRGRYERAPAQTSRSPSMAGDQGPAFIYVMPPMGTPETNIEYLDAPPSYEEAVGLPSVHGQQTRRQTDKHNSVVV